MTTFLFLRLTHDLLELPRAAVGRGEPRIRPFVSTSVSVPPGYPGLPDRDTEPTAAPLATCVTRVPAPIDVHGSLDRAKDVSSFLSRAARD